MTNRYELVVHYEGVDYLYQFRSGGAAVSPYAVTAAAGGGYAYVGKYEPTTVTGTVTCSLAALNAASRMFRQTESAGLVGSAIHRTYMAQERILIEKSYGVAVCARAPRSTPIGQEGAEAQVEASFSLNDGGETVVKQW